MNTTPKLRELPKERLERVASASRPFRRELGGPNYLIAIALVLIILSIVAVALIGGTLGSNIFAEYARRIMESGK